MSYERYDPHVDIPFDVLTREAVDKLIAVIMIATLLFNAVLAAVNAHVTAVTNGEVIAAELLIFFCSALLLALTLAPHDRPWLALMFLLIGMGLVVSLFRDELVAKNIRDVLSIPVFVMLGLRYSSSPVSLFSKLQFIVVFFALLEVANPDLFSDIFDVRSYYINSRNFTADDFWNSDSSLFVSATRPGERFFSFVDIHRVSSIFLEPVSLGNYVCIMVILLICFWSTLSLIMRTWLVVSTVSLLVACDGRFATVTSALILLCVPLASKLPSRAAVFYLPTIVILGAIGVYAFHPDPLSDDFGGRVAKTMELAGNLNFYDVLGMAEWSQINDNLDSGLTYLIVTQTALGGGFVWLFTTLVASDHVPDMEIRLRIRRATHAVAIFIGLNLLVSYSLFSIKSAAFLWFLYGAAIKPMAEDDMTGDLAS
ncbi:polysaccharide biosynthesis protein GumE [Hyphomicrobium sp.]|uniref:polysaccharide biosynthesis protein GumE n=1 Tax=Hyphomicrobium sp. TaxID=82 RepID=UPI001D318282|nr:polysaccharide biosynthesis protein GumE [Hyphomicrobium sp.]MBY0561600.1 polysaccharide biosynthesis protein GumE [Hyphomicrobium sp.]